MLFGGGEEGEEVGGDGGFEVEGGAGAGLVEGEAEGVEAEAACAVDVAVVFVVAHDGVVQHLHVHADLVFAAGVQMEFEQGELVVLLEQSPVG